MSNHTFKTTNDIRQVVSGWLERYDPSMYGDWDELIDDGVQVVLNFLEESEQPWRNGEDVDLTDLDFDNELEKYLA